MTAAPKLEELSDHELVERIRAGARDEFEVLVRRHNQRLYRAARAILKSDDEAEDIVQQAWLEVFRNLGQFRGDAAFTTWATRIAVNAAITLTRKRPLIAEVLEVAADDKPDDDVERAQLGALLEQCLERLPQGNREVMVLRDVLELDTAETAELLGLSEEAVRVRLHRARAAAAADLGEVGRRGRPHRADDQQGLLVRRRAVCADHASRDGRDRGGVNADASDDRHAVM